jgi:hypothetical protein
MKSVDGFTQIIREWINAVQPCLPIAGLVSSSIQIKLYFLT